MTKGASDRFSCSSRIGSHDTSPGRAKALIALIGSECLTTPDTRPGRPTSDLLPAASAVILSATNTRPPGKDGAYAPMQKTTSTRTTSTGPAPCPMRWFHQGSQRPLPDSPPDTAA